MNNQEAIEILREKIFPCVVDDWKKAVGVAISALQEQDLQPNLQHTCNQLATDAISRQAAIDIVTGYSEQLNGYIGTPNDTDVYAYARGLILGIERNLNALQSAQPEIIRCKDCKYYIKSESYCDYLGITISDLDFCSCAERRTDGVDS